MPGSPRFRRIQACRPLWATCASLLLSAMATMAAQELPEYRLKAGLLYNFAQFTEWPATVGNSLDVCVLGQDPFGPDLDALQGKAVGTRFIAVHRKSAGAPLTGCAVVFVASSAMGTLPRVLAELRENPTLTVADTPGAMRRGVILNMTPSQGKIAFEVNLKASRTAHLTLSSKVLRLATDVQQ